MTPADMQKLAARLQKALPASQGFALLVFDFGAGGNMNYVSNANREQMVSALVELLARLTLNGDPGPTIAALEETIRVIRELQS